MSRTTLLAIVMAVLITILIFIKESKNDSEYVALKDDAVIVAFGDSLTSGFGASAQLSYPSHLERKTGLIVINAGVNGETSSEGIHRLPLFLEHKPDLVILCHGGNDILQKLSSVELKKNLLAMIGMIKQSGSEVMLVGVPDFTLFGFDTYEVYDEVADETGVIYEDDVLRYIELRSALKSDYIHPNEKGYEVMADAFIEVLIEKNLLNKE